MPIIVLDITMSLDGFIAGSNISSSLPMGENGLRLHDWIFDRKTESDAKILGDLVASTGAVIVGRTTFDTAIDEAWEGSTPFEVPAFVVSHRDPERQIDGFKFVNGLPEAVKPQGQPPGQGTCGLWEAQT